MCSKENVKILARKFLKFADDLLDKVDNKVEVIVRTMEVGEMSGGNVREVKEVWLVCCGFGRCKIKFWTKFNESAAKKCVLCKSLS